MGLFGEGALALLADPSPLCSQAFSQFARTEAIQRMEIFEYCQQLRQPESFLLPFQVVDMINYILQQLRLASKHAPISLKPGIQAVPEACPLTGLWE